MVTPTLVKACLCLSVIVTTVTNNSEEQLPTMRLLRVTPFRLYDDPFSRMIYLLSIHQGLEIIG